MNKSTKENLPQRVVTDHVRHNTPRKEMSYIVPQEHKYAVATVVPIEMLN